jgi:endonuclease
VRLIVARCEVTYTGRLSAYLPESTRLLIVKDDGAVLIHAAGARMCCSRVSS